MTTSNLEIFQERSSSKYNIKQKIISSQGVCQKPYYFIKQFSSCDEFKNDIYLCPARQDLEKPQQSVSEGIKDNFNKRKEAYLDTNQ